jgi:hypothetical protein
MPPAPPVIKIVLLLSFIIKYSPNYVTIYKVARKLSGARHEHNVLRMLGETARRDGVRRPAVTEIRGTIGNIVLDLPAWRDWHGCAPIKDARLPSTSDTIDRTGAH